MSSPKNLKVGTRASPLALIQVQEISSLLAQHHVPVTLQTATYQTQGDKDKKTSLTANAPDDFFTNTLDEALINGEIDVAVHSAKDVPKKIRPGLSIVALTASLDETDAFVGKTPFHQLPAGAKVGTSSLTRQEAVKKLNPHVHTVDIRGTIQERLNLVDQGQCDGVIVATVALKRLGLAERIRDIMPWEAVPLQGQLAVVARSNDFLLKTLFAAIDVRRRYGPVYLVGAGPGDPGLITVKGIDILKRADFIFYDFLIDKGLLNHAPHAEKIYVGKRKGLHTMPQSELSRLLRQKAIDGKTVVRLKGGDPLIFGRGAEEMDYLRSYHIDVRVIPGVSSATAIAAQLEIPLTARGLSSSVAFLSAHTEEGDSSEIHIPQADTLVFLMGLTRLENIVQALRKAGWPEESPIVIVSKGTRSDEKRVLGTVATIVEDVKRNPLDPPAIIIAGKTVAFFAEQLTQEPVILYTGTNPEKYRFYGRLIHFPTIELRAAARSPQEAADILSRLAHYDLIVFTSRFGVRYFLDFLHAHHVSFYPKEVAAVGHETAQTLKQAGIQVATQSPVETGEGLFEALSHKGNLKGKKILFPRSSLSNPYLETKLREAGADVDVVTIYENIKPPARPLPHEPISAVIFTSPSTVKNFLEDYGKIPETWSILAKGPRTHEALIHAGYSRAFIMPT